MTNIWNKFKQHFPNADLSSFRTKSWFDNDKIFYTSNDEKEKIAVYDGNKINSPSYLQEIKLALGLISGFPKELTLNNNQKSKIPAVDFREETHLGNKLTNQTIYVTPSDTFKIKFRDIFIDTETTYYSGKESHTWLNSPNMTSWSQQFNFALWCSTTA